MKKTFLIIAAAVCWFGGIFAQELAIDTTAMVPVSDSLPAVSADTAAWASLMQWRQWWEASLNYQRLEMPEEALASAESALTRSRALGLDLPAIGEYLDIKARQAITDKNWEQAAAYSKLSMLADGYSFKNNFTEFAINRHSKGLFPSLGQLIQKIKSYRRDFRFQYTAGRLAGYWLSLFFAAGGLFFLLLLAAKYLPYFLHLAADQLPQNRPYYGRMFLISSVGSGFLIVLAGLSLSLAVLVPAAFIIILCSTREKVMFWVSFLLLGIAVLGFSLVRQFIDIGIQGRVEALARANTSYWDEDLVRELIKQQQQDQSDLKPLYALSIMEKNRGRLDRAKTYLSAVIEASGDNPVALNNLGNLYFFRGDFDSASLYYRRVIELDDQLAEAHYNLAQVYFKRIDFNQARAEQEKAAALAPDRMESKVGQSGGNMVLDVQLDAAMLWPEALKGLNLFSAFRPREFVSLVRLNLWLPLGAWLALLALSGIWMLLAGNSIKYRYCSLCGRMICHNCQATSPDGKQHCRNCYYQVFSIQSPDIQQKATELLSRKAAKQRKLIFGFANALLPVSSFVMSGGTVKGWILSMLMGIIYASLVFLTAPWITARLDFYPAPAVYWYAAGSGMIIYIVSWIGYIKAINKQGAGNAA